MQICGAEALVEGKVVRVARLQAEGYDCIENPDAVLHLLKKSRARVDLLTFIPKLVDKSLRYEYPMEMDNIAALPVSTYENWLSGQIDFRTRNKVRKAAKQGVVVRELPVDEDLIRGITAIYNEAPVRQGKPFWHYGKGFAEVRSMNENFVGRSIFIGAFHAESLIGFARLVTTVDGSQAGLMQLLSMMEHRDKAPTNALIAEAVRSCAMRGIPYLWYANYSYGKKQEDSLADFKRHNGFQRIEIPRYYIPLTMIGHIALRTGIHHKLIEWIPEPLTTVFRRIRRRWYARKMSEVGNV